MITLLCILGTSFVACVGLIPLLAWLARQVGLLDRPDGRRKIHAKPVPLVGGVAVFGAITVALSSAALWSPWAAGGFAATGLSLSGLIVAAGVIAAVGVADDRFGLRGRYKLLGQLVAVAVLVQAGFVVRGIDLFGWSVPLGVFAVPFTVVWLLGAINSLNLIDGMDGMVGCVGLVIAGTIAAMAVYTGRTTSAAVAVALAGALVGFLCFNLPPARVFLGDCGSMLIGLLVGVMAIHSALKGPATVMLGIPLALLVIPLFDTTAAITRRTLTGRSIYTTDRGHIHHCLQRSGLSHRRALALVSFLCLLAGLGALASLALQRQELAVGSALAVVGILTVTRLFGHAELLLVKKRLTGLVVQLRSREDEAHTVCVRLQGNADWQDIWQTLTETSVQLNLLTVRLDVNVPAIHEGYHARWDRLFSPSETAQVWSAEIPLAVNDQAFGRIAVTGLRDRDPVGEKIGILSKIAADIEQKVEVLADGARPGAAGASDRARPEPLHAPADWTPLPTT